MGNYSINELEKLSGVKAHTIRIWEQRYGLLKPKRTSTGIRVYNDDQLKHLLNVSLLLKKGFKISKISKLKADEINKYLLNLYTVKADNTLIEDKINGLVIAMIELNEDLFNQVFASSVRGIGFKEAIIKVIYPFMNRVGVFWAVGDINPAQEHFISNLVRQKIIRAIDGQLPNANRKKILLYLPEGELHEIGLLTTSYLIKDKGWNVIYLGQSVPLQAVGAIYKARQPDAIMTFFTTQKTVAELNRYLKDISSLFFKSNIYISGIPDVVAALKIPTGIKWLVSPNDIDKIR